MKKQIQNYNQIVLELKQQYPLLTEFELLSLAIQIERNQILENGFVVSSDDRHPSGLEAIAIALGFENNNEDMIKKDNTENPNSFSLPIEQLPLTFSIKEILKKQKILTIGDLVCYTKEGISKIKYMKGKGANDIEEALSNMGLCLGMKKHY